MTLIRSRARRALAAALALLPLARPAALAAQPSVDAAGDFLATYVGPRGGDLDILRVDFTFDGTAFRLSSRSAAAIGTTPGAPFVWGIDRGAGTPGFPTLAPGVRFDAVVVVNPLGATTVRDRVSGTATTLPGSAVQFAGADLFVDVSAALLPSRGLALGAYTANLWPRVGTGNNNQISDFAPDDANILVTTTPEPAAAALLAPALVLLGAGIVRRRLARDRTA